MHYQDEWIMSRYTDMVKKSNDAFIAYEFANATTATSPHIFQGSRHELIQILVTSVRSLLRDRCQFELLI